MGIHGIGIDIVHVPRITALISRRGPFALASRILSHQEYKVWEKLNEKGQETRQNRFLAVRWAVKEAAYKALYPAVRPTWKELTLRNLGFGPLGTKPVLTYHPVQTLDDKIGKIYVSISHDGEYVVANVLVEEASK